MYKGIDISEWNYNYSVSELVKNDFCIIRAGFTGYGGNGTSKYIDNYFETNYNKCIENNISVGCYYYSCARTREQGQEEAKFLLDHCLKGKKFDYPIFIDVENEQWQRQNKKGVTEAVKGFCEYLENRGYFVGVYGSDIATFKEMVYLNELTRYCIWVASWNGVKPQYVAKYGLWQYDVKGVDCNYSYNDYSSIIKKAGLNGYGEEFEPTLNTYKVDVELSVEAINETEAKSIVKVLYNTLDSIKEIKFKD